MDLFVTLALIVSIQHRTVLLITIGTENIPSIELLSKKMDTYQNSTNKCGLNVFFYSVCIYTCILYFIIYFISHDCMMNTTKPVLELDL
jgi:hypothetical protein